MLLFLHLVISGLGGGSFDFGANIGIIEISGLIHTGGGGLFSMAGGSEPIMEAIREAAEDKSIKAVVLRINSGGGSAAASQAIAEEVRKLEEEKPVVASFGDVAASGGYYVAAPATKIVANPATLTGSIGVIMEMLRYYELMERYGVEGESLTTGKYKDIGSPFRPMRPDEKQLMQGMLDDILDQFVKEVAAGRGMEESEVRELADARVLTGKQALEVGLVDELGNLHDAIELAGELAGIKGKPSVRHLGKPSGLGIFMKSLASPPMPLRSPDPWWYRIMRMPGSPTPGVLPPPAGAGLP